MDDFVELYRTMDTWKAQLLTSALEECGIIGFQRTGPSSGMDIRTMEIVIFVPGDRENEANEILEQMPFDREDETHPHPDQQDS